MALTDLVHLDLGKNGLYILPVAIARLPKLKLLNVSGNPMIFPPASLIFGGDAYFQSTALPEIIAYFDEVERRGCCELKRMKIVVLGDGMAGKTTFIRSMVRGVASMTDVAERTKVVDISMVSIQGQGPMPSNILFDVFDFGGQDEYRVTHQLFLGGERTLFALVVPMNEEISEDNITSWIRHIASRAPTAVIMLVASKLDLCKKSHPLRRARVAQFHEITVRVVAQLRAAAVRKAARLGYTSEEDIFDVKIPSTVDKVESDGWTGVTIKDKES
jgi:small GTP-binding protein